MIDFEPLRDKDVTIGQLTADLTPDDLSRLTNEMVAEIIGLIADCTDGDITFLPEDPDARDNYASAETELHMPWTLGHVIVHVTASSEESAFLAAEMARGVPAEQRRSRVEVPWQSMTTLAQCHQRLEESRRMRLASLQLWPDQPHLDNVYTPWPDAGEVNAVGRFVLGLVHEDSHLAQIADIVRQARASRS